MTVEYRTLNMKTKKDVYLLPCINDMLDQLIHVCFLSTIDLVSGGYHQIGLAKDA